MFPVPALVGVHVPGFAIQAPEAGSWNPTSWVAVEKGSRRLLKLEALVSSLLEVTRGGG